MENLGRNLGNLHFGGDATTEWFGFMQGAYIAGEKNGKIVANLVKKAKGWHPKWIVNKLGEIFG